MPLFKITNQIKKDKKPVKIVLVALIFILIILLIGIFIRKPSYKPRKSIKNVQDLDALIAQADKLINSIKHKSGVNTKSNKTTSDSRSLGQVKLVLEGVIRSETGVSAVINNQIVGLNDKIMTFRVIDIAEQSVMLEDNQGNIRVISIYDKR